MVTKNKPCVATYERRMGLVYRSERPEAAVLPPPCTMVCCPAYISGLKGVRNLVDTSAHHATPFASAGRDCLGINPVFASTYSPPYTSKAPGQAVCSAPDRLRENVGQPGSPAFFQITPEEQPILPAP